MYMAILKWTVRNFGECMLIMAILNWTVRNFGECMVIVFYAI